VRAILFDASIFAVAAFAAFAQPSDKGVEFDAASVKLSIAGPSGRVRGKISETPGRLSIVSMQLRPTIAWAYHVQPSQVSGPASLETEWYDIIATTTGAAGQEQLRQMLRRLLQDRFKLALQRKTQVMAAYALTRRKGASKLHGSTENDESGTDAGGPAMINIKRATVVQFTRLLSDPLKSPVVDMTGLKGLYDFKLDIVPYIEGGVREGVDDSKLDIPDILSQAIQDQLGLKLELRKVPIEILVVEHVERPSAN
jgi:uncharacterized protein (TIGR03435 family)